MTEREARWMLAATAADLCVPLVVEPEALLLPALRPKWKPLAERHLRCWCPKSRIVVMTLLLGEASEGLTEMLEVYARGRMV